MRRHPALAEQRFHLASTGGDGTLTWHELAVLLEEVMGLAPREVRYLLSATHQQDVLRSGRAGWADLKQVLSRHTQPFHGKTSLIFFLWV